MQQVTVTERGTLKPRSKAQTRNSTCTVRLPTTNGLDIQRVRIQSASFRASPMTMVPMCRHACCSLPVVCTSEACSISCCPPLQSRTCIIRQWTSSAMASQTGLAARHICFAHDTIQSLLCAYVWHCSFDDSQQHPNVLHVATCLASIAPYLHTMLYVG